MGSRCVPRVACADGDAPQLQRNPGRMKRGGASSRAGPVSTSSAPGQQKSRVRSAPTQHKVPVTFVCVCGCEGTKKVTCMRGRRGACRPACLHRVSTSCFILCRGPGLVGVCGSQEEGAPVQLLPGRGANSRTVPSTRRKSQSCRCFPCVKY